MYTDKGGVFLITDSKRYFSKKTVLKYWIFSYAVVLIIPLIAGIIMYGFSMDSFKKEINNANIASLLQMKSNIEQKMSEIKSIGNSLSLNERISRINGISGDFQEYHRYSFRELQSDLSKFVTSNQIISGIYVYYTDRKMTISDQGIYFDDDMDFFSKEYFNTNTYTLNSLFDKRYNKKVLVSPYKMDNQMFFIDSMPFSTSSKIKTNLVIKLNEKILLNAMKENTVINTNKVAFIDSDGTILSPYLKSFPQTMTPIKNYPNKYNFNANVTNIDKTSYNVIETTSDYLDGKYYLFYPSNQTSASVSTIKLFTTIYIIVSIVLGCLYAYYIINNNYKHIRRTLKFAVDTGLHSGNELEVIETSFEKMLEQNKILHSKLYKNSCIMRQLYLSNLIQGNVSFDDFSKEYFTLDGASLQKETFLIGLVKITDYKNLFFENNIYGDKNYHTAREVIRNILVETISEKYNCEYTVIKDTLIFIVNFSKSSNIVSNISDFFEKSSEYIKSEFDLSFTYGFSECFDDLSAIYDYYDQALQVVNYNTNKNTNLHAHAHAHVHANNRQFFYSELKDLIVTKMIQNSDVTETINDTTVINDDYKDKNKYDEIIRYIDENITNPNLNMSLVLEKFNMTASYFSKAFKKYNTLGYLDYVHTKRIEYAKKLMSETDLSIKDISKRCGYYSDIAFNRAFNRYENTSPGKFRAGLE